MTKVGHGNPLHSSDLLRLVQRDAFLMIRPGKPQSEPSIFLLVIVSQIGPLMRPARPPPR